MKIIYKHKDPYCTTDRVISEIAYNTLSQEEQVNYEWIEIWKVKQQYTANAIQRKWVNWKVNLLSSQNNI